MRTFVFDSTVTPPHHEHEVAAGDDSADILREHGEEDEFRPGQGGAQPVVVGFVRLLAQADVLRAGLCLCGHVGLHPAEDRAEPCDEFVRPDRHLHHVIGAGLEEVTAAVAERKVPITTMASANRIAFTPAPWCRRRDAAIARRR